MLRDLLLPEGAFASSQDADTDGVEGLTYTWTAERRRARRAAPAVRARALDRPRRARPGRCARGCSEIRAERPQPGLDDKAIASWNGLALAALAEAARRLERDDWRDAARGLAEFLLGPLSDGRPPAPQLPGRQGDGHRLSRRLRERRARALRAARRDRRAALARGVAPPGAARGRALRRRRARRLLPHARRRRGARRAHEGPRRQPDPSGNSMLAYVLLRLARIYGDDELERHAVSVLRLVRDLLPRAPSAFGWALCALDLHFSPPREIAIVGSPDDAVARPRSPATTRTPSSPSARPRTCRCSRARSSSTASPPSTSASASPARRRSRTRQPS